MAYVTLNDVKLYRGIATTTTSDDALLTVLIGRAEKQIDNYCHRTFQAPSTAAVHYYDAICDVSDDRRTLYLDDDLASITTIVNGDGKTITSTAYVPEPRNATPYHAIRLTRNAYGLWTWEDTPEDAITVTGRWGYATTAPDDIKQATIRLVSYLYAQKDASVFDVTAMPDMGVMTVPQGMPRDVREILEPYRKLR